MLLLEPFSEDQGRSMLPLLRFASCTSFQCAYEFLHSQTRICDRLLGPCFKTGQYEPSWQDRTKRPQSSRSFGVQAEGKPPTFCTLIPTSLNPSCLLPPKSQKTSLGIRQPLTNCYPHQTYITPLTSMTIDSFVPLPSQRFQVF